MPSYCRFEVPGGALYGVLAGESIESLSGAPWAGGRATGKTFALREVRLLPPCEPTKIVCVGRNYRDHAAELNNPVPREPLFFLKPPSALLAPEDAIVLPPQSRRVDYEGEVALVIGQRCQRLQAAENPLDYVFGFTCLNDVTARDIQKADGHFTRGKGFDTFCPLGPCVVAGLEAGGLTVETFVNGQQRQRGSLAELIFPLDVIIRSIAAVMTLEPGDVIATGTPAGVGPLAAGDVVEVVVEGIGRLRNSVVAAAEPG